MCPALRLVLPLILLCTLTTKCIAIPQLSGVYVEWCSLENLSNGQYEHFSVYPENSLRVAAGTFVKIKCNPGYRLIGGEKLECGIDGKLLQQAYCEDIDECNLISHEEDITDNPSSIMSSDVIEPNPWQELVAGTTDYPCDTTATCINHNGSFSCQCHTGMHCNQFTQCKQVQIPEFGKIIEQSQVHVTFMCNVGHRLIGSDKRLCIDGNWSGVQPSCKVLTCTPPSIIISNGWSNTNENITYTYGNEIQYGCNRGYRLVGGNSKRICTTRSAFGAEDVTYWSGHLPSCQVIRCPNPGRISNGVALVTSQDIGGEVSFRCNSGYRLIGSTVRVCQENGKWSGTLTTCNDPETFCPTPGIPFNGRVTGSTKYNLDDVITFECNYGYDIIGSRVRQCTVFGQWSGEEPVCLGGNEYDDVELLGDHLAQTAIRYREEFHTQNITSGLAPFHYTIHNLHDSTEGGLDVYFVFDVSKSVRIGDTSIYIEAIDFAKALVEKMGVSPTGAGGTRYGAIAYASKPILMFHLTLSTREEVYRSLDELKHIVKAGSLGDGTATATALRMVHEYLIPQSLISSQLRDIRSQETDKVLFLLTDGHSNMKGLPEVEADILKSDWHVVINCIGIGSDVDREELNSIASEPESIDVEHVFLLDDHSLSELTAKVTRTDTDYSTCGESRGPQNTNTTTAEDVWPWQAGIYTYKGIGLPTFFCGGSLIAPNWILSTAHCFDPNENRAHKDRDDATNLIVVMGINERIKDGIPYRTREQERYVKRIVIHPKYNSLTIPRYDYDIALLELKEPFTLTSFVRTVCLPPSTNWSTLLTPGEQNKAFATGWGKMKFGDTNKYVDHLKQLALPIRSKDDPYCRVTEWEGVGNLTERMFCAGYADGSLDACTGDSGGPLVRKWLPQASDGAVMSSEWHERWYQVGLVSWGESCAKKNHYGYYTHLPRLVKWVEGELSGTGSVELSPSHDNKVVDGRVSQSQNNTVTPV